MVTTFSLLLPIQAVQKHYLIETDDTPVKTNHGKPKQYLIKTEHDNRNPTASYNEQALYRYASEYFKPLEKRTIQYQKINVGQSVMVKASKTKQYKAVTADKHTTKDTPNKEFVQNDYGYTLRSEKLFNILPSIIITFQD